MKDRLKRHRYIRTPDRKAGTCQHCGLRVEEHNGRDRFLVGASWQASPPRCPGPQAPRGKGHGASLVARIDALEARLARLEEKVG